MTVDGKSDRAPTPGRSTQPPDQQSIAPTPGGAPPFEADAEQVEVLQSITANLLLENAALRYHVDQLRGRVDALEHKADGR